MRSALGWDGCLPLLVALSPEVMPLVLPGRDLPSLAAVIGVPIVAALIRAHVGSRRLQAIEIEGRSWGRHVLFALAIVMLLVFEGFLAALQCPFVRELEPWLLAGGIYLGYLGLVLTALRPGAEKREAEVAG